MYEPDKDIVSYRKFTGLRNTVGPESLELSDLDAALNVDVTDELRVRRRRGYSSSLSAGSYHSVWSDGNIALVVGGTTLYEVTPTFALRSVRTGLTSGRRMYYANIPGHAKVFYSNGVETGVFENSASRTWGISPPAYQPAATVTGGSLRAGLYQYAATFLRRDGQESGTPGSALIELTATGGISFTQIPISTDPGVVSVRLYITPVNGDQMYSIMLLPNGTTTARYEVDQIGDLPLQTQFLFPAPAGIHLAVLSGFALVARDNILYPSEPWAMELFDPRKAVPVTKRITLVAPVADGLYLGSENEIGWLDGLDPAKWSFVRKADYGAIPGTLAYSPLNHFVPGSAGTTAVFASTKGLCLGAPGGQFQNLTQDRFNYPAMDEGAGVIREMGGSIQYVVTLKGTERPANVAF